MKRIILFLALLSALLLLTAGCGKNPIPATTEAETTAPAPTETAAPVIEYREFEDSYTDRLPERAADGLTLHAFNWTYHEILINLENISNAGFKNVLTMPVQQPKGGGSSWWAFYQPLGFSIGDNSALGSREELAELCAEAEKYGVCILADLVLNHLATTDDEGKEADGTPMVSPAVAAYEPVIYANRNENTDGTGLTFHHNKNASGSGADTQYYAYGNLPDLDTSNAFVQSRVLDLMKECIDAGIDGFRFDAAKHIETEKDPDYPSDFWDQTLEKAKEYYKEKTGQELYVYGEILGSPAGRSLTSYTDHMRITDDGFATQLKNVFAKKDPSLILAASLKTDDASQLIAWVESHDEYVTTNTHYSDVRVAKFWSIIAAKKDLGGLYLARPTAELTVGQIGSYAFESEYVAVSNRFHNRFFDAESYESVDGTCYVNEKIKADDQGVLILNVGDVDPEKTVEVAVPHLEDGVYYDSLTGSKVLVHDHVAKLQFEANGMAVVTRTKDIHPQLSVSDRDCSFVGDKEIKLSARNCDEAYCYFNGNEADRLTIGESSVIKLKDHVQDGKVDLHVYLRKGVNVFEQVFTYTQVQLIEGKFNVINLDEKYLNGDYEIYIWSWSPGLWSKNYEIRDGVLLVDTTGMTGFLIAVFEKGYQIGNPTAWDSHVLKQSSDIKGDILKEGFFDMTGF
jgi:alpha-amylase